MDTEGTELIVLIREVSVVWRSWMLRDLKGSIMGLSVLKVKIWGAFKFFKGQYKSLQYKLSITCKTDRNFGKISEGVFFPKSCINENDGKISVAFLQFFRLKTDQLTRYG